MIEVCPFLPSTDIPLSRLLRSMGSLVIPFIFFSIFLSPAIAQNGPSNWTALPFSPPAYPLAVRSPYLNVWLPQGDNPSPAYTRQNTVWDLFSAVQWYASVVVDDREYRLLSPWAAGEALANQTAVEFTATRTSFLMSASGVQVNMSFLSPIEPNNFTLQSLPFAYLYMTAQSLDGQEHRVRMYSDIEGHIATGDSNQVIEWSTDDSDDYVVHSIHLPNQVPFVENNIHPQDATVYYSFKKIEGKPTTWTIAGFNRARGVFFANPIDGNLDDQVDQNYRPPASGNETPVFGMSIDWGNISSTPEPAVWALGVYRNPTVQYLTPEGSFQDRSPYFASVISDSLDAPKFVLDDFPRALEAAEALDTRIRADGEAFSTQYADLLVLSARQAMGTLDITLPPPNDGAWDTSDVKIFMKNIGSVGSDNETIASVNNVDALYAAFPVFLYLNPDIGGYLLAPLLEYQGSSAYKLPYAAKNIGSAYPSATANNLNVPHIYGVDETAGMIIMTLAYSLASGNGTLIAKHYGLLRDWAEYLANNTITPFNQSSGDFSANSDFISANQTNLALKGIIGIAAMARIAEAAGENDDQQRFKETAISAIQFWQDQALSASHVNFFYGDSDSNGLMYNLYADKLLHLELVPDSVYTLLTTYYQNIAGQTQYGIPLDNSPSQNTTTNWMMFAASTAKSTATRDLLISQIHAYASNNLNDAPFTSIYDPSTGLGGPGTSAGIASPAQGGIFALLALGTTSKTITVPDASSSASGGGSSGGGSSGSSKVNAGIIAGSTVAGIVAICFIAFMFMFLRRRHRLRKDDQSGPKRLVSTHIAEPYILSPQASDAHTYTVTASSALDSYDIVNSVRPRSADLTQTVVQRGEVTRREDTKGGRAMASRDTSQMVSLVARIREVESRNTGSGSNRNQGVESLRNELDTLRREVELMRQQRLVGEDAPPLYSDQV